MTGPASHLRVHLGGLLEEERKDLGLLCARRGGVCVEDESYNLLFVDLRHPASNGLLQSRSKQAVLVTVCGEGERSAAADLRLARSRSSASTAQVFLAAEALVQRRGAAPNTGLRSLASLAERYRFELARAGSILVLIEGNEFRLLPQKGLYRSAHPLRSLEHYLSSDALDIQIRVEEEDPHLKLSKEPARRLEEFLWELGNQSTEGELLPWLSQERRYKLLRWPPVARKETGSASVKLATILARRAFSPGDLCNATGIDLGAIANFLNGCSVAGCLESFSAQEGPQTRASAKDQGMAGLLGRIRRKLGLN